jgi:hypothetical protein
MQKVIEGINNEFLSGIEDEIQTKFLPALFGTESISQYLKTTGLSCSHLESWNSDSQSNGAGRSNLDGFHSCLQTSCHSSTRKEEF